jgi:hypothetical protein
MSETYWTIAEGADVIGSDGEQLGTVDRVEGEMMIIRKGWVFTADHAIPLSVITAVSDTQVTLKVTGDEALAVGQSALEPAQGDSAGRQDHDADVALGTDATHHQPRHAGQSSDVPSTDSVSDDSRRE